MTVAGAMTAADVKRANRRLYDAVAADYEALDGRRDERLVGWVRSRLRALTERHGSGVLLDLGSGSGLVSRAARGLFAQTIALDLSPRILMASASTADHKVAADVDALPFATDSADVVTCFATLHHLYDSAALVSEIARVLRPGGGFWSDHDMDRTFYRRFRWPLFGYRCLRGAARKYARDEYGIDRATYRLAEFREDGVDSHRIVAQLQGAGLTASASFHWYGLTSLTDRLFGRAQRSRGWAPLLCVTATKPGEGSLAWRASS